MPVIIYPCRFVFARISNFRLISGNFIIKSIERSNKPIIRPTRKHLFLVKCSHRIIDLFQCSIFISICARFPPSYVLNPIGHFLVTSKIIGLKKCINSRDSLHIAVRIPYTPSEKTADNQRFFFSGIIHSPTLTTGIIPLRFSR